MTINSEIQIFLKNRIEEIELLKALSNSIGMQIESLDYPDEEARFFLQYLEYGDDFHTSINIAWPGTLIIAIKEDEVARDLAVKFKTLVLLNVSDKDKYHGMEWCLFEPTGRQFAVEVVEAEDGIFVINDSKIAM